MCFGMIAHYDINGFYETFFTSDKDRVEFVEMVLNYPCYGSPAFTYCDIEKQIQQWILNELGK